MYYAEDEIVINYKSSISSATISGEPTDINQDTILSVNVDATDAEFYYYKVIESGFWNM